MSRIRLSDSTLDALADGRRLGIVAATGGRRATDDPDTSWTPMGLRPTLLDCGRQVHGWQSAYDRYGSRHWQWCCYLAEARLEWRMASPDALHVHLIPGQVASIVIERYDDGSPRRSEMVVDAGELGGPPFAPAFVSHLDAPIELLPRMVKRYRERTCAGKHLLWADHRGRVLCGSLLLDVVATGIAVDDAADVFDLTPERAGRLLVLALAQIWDWRVAAINEWEAQRPRVATAS